MVGEQEKMGGTWDTDIRSNPHLLELVAKVVRQEVGESIPNGITRTQLYGGAGCPEAEDEHGSDWGRNRGSQRGIEV